MLIKQIYAVLEKSSIFQKFREENPEAFLCAGFFILNFKQSIFEYALDYRTDKQIFTFNIPLNKSGSSADIKMNIDELLPTPKPLDEINLDIQLDLEEIREIVEKQLTLNEIKNRLEEIIAVLQNLDGKTVWNLTILCEGFTIINAIVNSENSQVIKFEKKNLMDFMKKK